MSEPEANSPPLTRESYNHWTRVSMRYCDQDPIGHINNAAMAAYIEQGRVALVYPMLQAANATHIELVIARLIIDYRAELTFPGMIEIGSRVARIGGKSFVLHHGVFKGGEETCAATAQCIMVYFDKTKRQSMLPPSDVRQSLERFMAEQPA